MQHSGTCRVGSESSGQKWFFRLTPDATLASPPDVESIVVASAQAEDTRESGLDRIAGVRFRRGRAKGSYCPPTIRVAGNCRTAPVERGTTRHRVCLRLADRAAAAATASTVARVAAGDSPG